MLNWRRLNIALVLVCGVALSACQPNPPSTNSDGKTKVTEAQAQTPIIQTQKQQPITILALGDSLTEGLGVSEDNAYPAQLQAALAQQGYTNVLVINSGLSGETSSGLVNRIDWVLQTQPDITILTIGANDAMRGIEVATIEQNIRQAIKDLRAGGSQVILGGMQIYDNLGAEYGTAFADMYPCIARDMQVAYIPFFLEGVAGDRALNQPDAIHPTAEGYTIVVNDNILPVLTPVLDKVQSEHYQPAQSN